MNTRTDPYANVDICAMRLFAEWLKHNKLIIAVDFDDTVFDFKSSGDTHPAVLNALKKCMNHEFYIVPWTASSPDRYEFIRQFFLERGITVSEVNCNPIELPFGNHKKIYYNLLLDDRAGLGGALITLEYLFAHIDNHKTTLTKDNGN